MRAAERRIAALLEDVARDAEFPATPPLAASVRRRIESGPMPVARVRLPRTRPPVWRSVPAVVLVVLVTLGATLALSVTARRAVADLLGVVGIHVTFDDETHGVELRPRNELDLGEQMSTYEAEERAGFDVVVPSEPQSRRVWAVYYDPTVGESGMVSLVHPPEAESVEDVDLLVTQFAASVEGQFFKKIDVEGADVTYTGVGDDEGYWVGGDAHLFYYVEDGEPRQETVRLAGRVLIWESDGVTYRVEGARSLEAALRIAGSLR
ncbi:MAG TPA: hypothetical protein VG318_18205 [Actinomycetota bacterium]|nr:hypothetical protein [Actinomycetota bacterium]